MSLGASTTDILPEEEKLLDGTFFDDIYMEFLRTTVPTLSFFAGMLTAFILVIISS